MRPLLLATLFLSTAAPHKRKPISTALNAKWSQTPVTLEASEFLNSENKADNARFPFFIDNE